jgi:signal transduction histidine kinase
LVILAVVVSALGAYRIRVKSVESRSRLLEEMVEQRTRTLEERTRELETLYRADEELYRNLNVDQVLQSLLDTAVDTLSANKGALMVWNEKHDKLVARAVHGFDPRNIPKLSFTPGQGITGTVAVSGEPVIITEADTDTRVTREIIEAENIRSFVQVPIKVGGEVFGVFSVDYTRHHQVTPQERDLLISLAQRAALAIQNAQLYEHTHEEAVAEERSRLARDLHDAVTQTLFSASLIAEALPAAWESDPCEGRSLLQELRSLSRGALAEMRTLLLELRPSVLVDANMSDLMRQLAEAASGREGIPVTLEMNGVCRLPQDVHIAIYRIAQEAINNVIKHARASSVSISLDCGPAEADGTRCLTLTVQDDGCGFDPHNIQGDRLGLQNMTERAQAIGAQLDIESGPGSGTIVRVQWMLADPCPENNSQLGVSNVYKIR